MTNSNIYMYDYKYEKRLTSVPATTVVFETRKVRQNIDRKGQGRKTLGESPILGLSS